MSKNTIEPQIKCDSGICANLPKPKNTDRCGPKLRCCYHTFAIIMIKYARMLFIWIGAILAEIRNA